MGIYVKVSKANIASILQYFEIQYKKVMVVFFDVNNISQVVLKCLL